MSDSPYIVNVTEENFQSAVIEASMQQPVLVDCWAEWCNPCQMLLPIVSKLAEAYNGQFILAKINSDEQQNLVVQMGVKSLPTVKLFKQGQIVDEFMGALSESEVKAFIDKHIEPQTSSTYQQAQQAYQAGDTETALSLFNQALVEEPDNDDIKFEIAQVVFAQGDFEGATALINSMSAERSNSSETKQLLSKISLKQQLGDAPDVGVLEQKILSNEQDYDAYLTLSNVYAADGQFEKACALLFKVMQKDRTFKDDAGRKGLINLFELLGPEHSLVKQYQRKMFSLMH